MYAVDRSLRRCLSEAEAERGYILMQLYHGLCKTVNKMKVTTKQHGHTANPANASHFLIARPSEH
jgi:hypothetical protein